MKSYIDIIIDEHFVLTREVQPSVTRLTIKITALKLMPADILSYYPNVTELSIKKKSITDEEIIELPADFFAPVRLNFLQITKCPINSLPSSLILSTGLRTLLLDSNYLTQIPDFPQGFTKLWYISMRDNRLTSLPHWLEKLPSLSYLNISKNPISQLPENMDKLVHLKTLYAYEIVLSVSPELLLRCPNLEDCGLSSENNPQNRQLSIFISSIYKMRRYLPNIVENISLKMALWRLFLGETDIRQVASSLLWAALQSCSRRLIAMSIAEISRRYVENAHRLQKGDKIAIIGHSIHERKPLIARLAALGIGLHEQICAKTTHILCGAYPSQQYSEAITAIMMTATDLERELSAQEGGYLRTLGAEEAEKISQNLSALLLSGNRDSIAIGLELIRRGGMPSGLLTPLFLVAKDNSLPDSLSDYARQLLYAHASPPLLRKLQYKIVLFRHYREWEEIERSIKEYANCPDLDLEVITEYVRRHRARKKR